jgi:hypothetical protein
MIVRSLVVASFLVMCSALGFAQGPKLGYPGIGEVLIEYPSSWGDEQTECFERHALRAGFRCNPDLCRRGFFVPGQTTLVNVSPLGMPFQPHSGGGRIFCHRGGVYSQYIYANLGLGRCIYDNCTTGSTQWHFPTLSEAQSCCKRIIVDPEMCFPNGISPETYMPGFHPRSHDWCVGGPRSLPLVECSIFNQIPPQMIPPKTTFAPAIVCLGTPPSGNCAPPKMQQIVNGSGGIRPFSASPFFGAAAEYAVEDIFPCLPESVQQTVTTAGDCYSDIMDPKRTTIRCFDGTSCTWDETRIYQAITNRLQICNDYFKGCIRSYTGRPSGGGMWRPETI